MRLWRYHKPPGLLTSHADPQGRPTVFDRLPKSLGRVISIGRLDLNSEGLLRLTNDGELARQLELPETGWARRYRVRVHGIVDEKKLKGLEKGVTVSGVSYGPIRAVLDNQQRANAWLTVSLSEGRNREIRKVMEHLGLEVNRLIRVAFGPFQLGNLSRGQTGEITGKVLHEQLSGGGGGVAHLAHLGGLLVGVIYLKTDWRASQASQSMGKAARARRFAIVPRVGIGSHVAGCGPRRVHRQ